MLFTRFLSLKAMLATGSHKLPAAKKALAMYYSCMGSQAEGKQDLVVVKELMRSIVLTWPELPEEDANALGVLSTLYFKWQILFWLSLRVHTGQNLVPRRPDVKPGDCLPILMYQYKAVVRVGGYVGYWNGYYEAFRDNAMAITDKENIEAFTQAEAHILKQLYNSLFSKKRLAIISCNVMGVFTALVSFAAWRDEINEQPNSRPKVGFHDVVLVRDIGHLLGL
ncbi:hypothetical protein MRX96_011700 [Rhipicephalus microplus]